MSAFTKACVGLAMLCALFIPVHYSNEYLFRLMNGAHSPFSDVLWLAITTLGDGLLLGIVLGGFLVKNPRMTGLGLFLLISSSLVMHLIKFLFPTLRPAAVVDTVHVLGPMLRSGSFPSGHTTASMAAGLALAYYSSSRITGACILGIATLIGMSRVFVGAHFPQDVIGGMILALCIFLIIITTHPNVLEIHIPDHPPYESPLFQALICLELLTTLSVVLYYGPHHADVPIVACAVGVIVTISVTYAWLSHRLRSAAG